MSATVSLLLLLLLAFSPAPRYSFGAEMNQGCPANITISRAEVEATVFENKKQFTYLYLHPEQGFTGVSIMAGGDGRQQRARFMLDNCFPQEATWWYLYAEIEEESGNNNDDQKLIYMVDTGVCHFKCTRTGPGGTGIQVVAHGPSSWRFKRPRNCGTMGDVPKGDLEEKCTEPQGTATKGAIVGVVVAAIVVVVVVMVMVFKRIRQRRDTSAEDVMLPSQGASATSAKVVAENSMYEAYENTNERVVMVEVENDLYESFENTNERVVVENNLYESVESLRDLQPR